MAITTQYTETYIANLVLSELGSKEVENVETDSSKGGRLIRLYYPVARDFVQARYPWSICRVRYKSIPAEATAPLWKWTYAHAQPPASLRVIETNLDEWKVEGRTIVCDDTPINVLSLDRKTNVSQFPPLMITAIAKWLVTLIAVSLTGDPDKRKEARKDFVDVLEQAQTVDSYQGSYELFQVDDLIKDR
jgi:hypothetical protein